MAEANKTLPTQNDAAAFIAAIPDERRRLDCQAVAALMQDVTGEPPVMWGDSIVGFGRYQYRYQSGRTGEWMKLGLASRKDAMTLYFPTYLEHHEDLLARLGKYKAGKGCLYVKRLEDVDLAVLRELMLRTAARPASGT